MSYSVKTVKQTASGSSELPLRIVELDGVPVGFVRKFRDTRTDKNPWQAFLYDGEFVPGETSSTLIGSFYEGGLNRAVEAIKTTRSLALKAGAFGPAELWKRSGPSTTSSSGSAEMNIEATLWLFAILSTTWAWSLWHHSRNSERNGS